MSDLAQRIAALSPEQRAEFLRQLRSQREQARRRIQPQPRDGRTFPLSFAQERMWFMHRWNSGSPLYNVHLAMWLEGVLDVPQLEAALRTLVARHEPLRTTFHVEGEQPVQRIAAAAELTLPVTEVASLAAFYAAAEEELRRPFVLEQGPLLRPHLYRLSATDAILLVTLHHIVADGWALGVFARELAAAYGGATLPALPFQYADYAVWQRAPEQEARLAELLDYWTEQLREVPELITLPTDRPRPAAQTFAGARLPLTLERELIDRLRALGQAEGATLFMVLFAAFAALLARLSGQEELVIGTPVANRTEGEVAGLMGVFVNTLALRVDLRAQPTFRELLDQVRQTALDAYAHQALPFANLVAALQPERSLSHAPFFQVSFGLQENPLGTLELPGLRAELLEARSLAREEALPALHSGMAMFDLTFHLSEIPKGVGGWIEYNTDLFDEGTVARWSHYYVTLLEAAAATPEAPVTHLPLLPEAEWEALLRMGQGAVLTPEAEPSLTLPARFTRQAARTPHAPAVVFAEGALTYVELERQANRLAHQLVTLGIGPERVVGVCLERSPEFVVAALAVLKAGGAYLPLDPGYPPERLAFMLEDGGAALVITTSALRSRLGLEEPVLCLDQEPTPWRDAPERPPEIALHPANLAYVIYTSGSTGRPKGVLVTHAGLPNLVRAQIAAFALLPGAQVLQFASFNFDASVSEIFTTLLSGATLHLAAADALLPGPALVRLLRERQISTVTLPPSTLAVLPEAELPALTTLVSAGEACPPEAPGRWANGRRFLNAYGPTEATVCATYAEVKSAVAPVPIGAPLRGVTCYVVDRYLEPVPIGVPGELLIGGQGVARGYRRRPGLTAERFIPDPFSRVPGARLYRTGDRVRWRADGQLEFLGRLDAQVKLRGYRIEPGEIEAALLRLPAVRGVAVVAQEGRLAAFVVPQPGRELDGEELEAALRRKLPDYLVPSLWQVLETLPLSPAGKVDRAALAALATPRRGDAPFVAPRNPLEEVLAGIWGELLGIERVGVHDNFFRLGGHSLLATRFFSQLYQLFGVEVPLRTLFEAPTVAGFAEALMASSERGEALLRAAELFLYVAQLSDEEVERQLQERGVAGGGG